VHPAREGRFRLVGGLMRHFLVSRELADTDAGVGKELVGRDFEIGGSRSLTDASGRVVCRTVARAEPAAILAALVADALSLRDAAEMGADADRHEPVFMPRLRDRII